MEDSILRVENLSVCYNMNEPKNIAVDKINFNLHRGSSLGIIGESGSGKTSVALALMGLIEKPANVEGRILFDNSDLNSLSEKEKNLYRWNKISIVFQNGLDILNPVLTVHEQILECILQHTLLSKYEAGKKVKQLFDMVGLDTVWAEYYPHQLSGGMQQRVFLAMALSCDPEILVVDEPTTSMDTVSKHKIMELLKRLQRQNKFALVVISHDMEAVTELTTQIIVLYSGKTVEEGPSKEVLFNPLHTYTRGLINASPDINPYRDLWGIPGEKGRNNFGGCPFYDRCNQKLPECRTKNPKLEYVSPDRRVACNRGGIVTLLSGKDIYKSFTFKGRTLTACENCEIKIRSGEVVVLTGESGSGKSTLAGILSGVLQADKGTVLFNGHNVKGNNFTRQKNGIQIVFQDPFTSINERLTILEAVMEPLDILKAGTRFERLEKVIQALKDVYISCDEEYLQRKCHTLSGGQRQRVSLARSLVMEPAILIADEIGSMLDSSTQANILRLLRGLQNKRGFAMLYITHETALARKIADRVYIMKKGKIIKNTASSFVLPAIL
jgi:peptide/nickel transport system ATP-binding protein